MGYKRNQVEEAVARILDPDAQTLSSELRTRIKRLLDLDRARPRNPRSQDPETAHFAFFTEKASGTGADVRFSDYEAFALLTGLRIMKHSWPQGFAVSVLRRLRPRLAQEHARVLSLDSAKLFDLEAIKGKAQAGDPFVDNADPVFLLLLSKPADNQSARAEVRQGPPAFAGFPAGTSITWLELTTMAHQLRDQLSKTVARRRGPPGGGDRPDYN